MVLRTAVLEQKSCDPNVAMVAMWPPAKSLPIRQLRVWRRGSVLLANQRLRGEVKRGAMVASVVETAG